MREAKVNYLAAVMLTLLLSMHANAKSWREITPLKSTRTDVERLLGQPNKSGRYEIRNERVRIVYAEQPCGEDSLYLRLNCKCLVATGTVLSIGVTLDSGESVSALGIDKTKYHREPFSAAHPSATYSDFIEGVVYSIDESDNVVTHIDYLPSAKDCQELTKKSAKWRGIVPLTSRRSEVERLLGARTDSIGSTSIYRNVTERVDVLYATDPCTGGEIQAVSANDVVVQVTVVPLRRILVRDLQMDHKQYERAEVAHPENWVEYTNGDNGVSVEAMINDSIEEVRNVVYRPTKRTRELRCNR